MMRKGIKVISIPTNIFLVSSTTSDKFIANRGIEQAVGLACLKGLVISVTNPPGLFPANAAQ
jgi:hypothetical protein